MDRLELGFDLFDTLATRTDELMYYRGRRAPAHQLRHEPPHQDPAAQAGGCLQSSERVLQTIYHAVKPPIATIARPPGASVSFDAQTYASAGGFAWPSHGAGEALATTDASY